MDYVSWSIVFLFASIVTSFVILYYYVRLSWRRIPLVSHMFIVISTIVCILPFPLLILDVDSAFVSKNAGWSANEHERFFRGMWLSLFIFTQVMAWIVLPIIQEYDCSGEQLPSARLRSSLRENLKIYFILIVILGCLLAYILFLKGIFTASGIFHVCLAAANAFGLTLLVITLSCGLVFVPKLLWYSADPIYILRDAYCQAPDIHEDLDMARIDTAELRGQLMRMDPNVTRDDNRQFMAELLEEIDVITKVVPLGHAPSTFSQADPVSNDEEVSHKQLVKIASRIRANSKTCLRLSHQWKSLVSRCAYMDDLIKNRPTRAIYWTAVRKPFLRTLAVLSAILSVFVVAAELVLPFQTNTSAKLSVVEYVVRNSNTHFIGASIFLCYIGGLAYWATFQFKMFDSYALFPANSSAAALCFSLIFLTRLILPVCYNFLWMSRLTDPKDLVVYSVIFGRMDVVDILGPWFNRFLPLGVPIIVGLILTKFFDRILMHIGVERHDVTGILNESVRSRLEDGRSLVSQECGKELGSATEGLQADGSDASTPRAVEMPKKKEPGQRYAEWKAKRAAQEKASAA